MVGRTSCDVCLKAYEGSGREPPCDACKPILKEVNVPYFVLYSYCQDQYIMGFNGPVGLNLLAVNQAMIDYKVPDEEKIEFSSTVRRIAGIVISARAEDASSKKK